MDRKRKLTMHSVLFDMLPSEIVSLIHIIPNVSILVVGADLYEQSKIIGEQLRLELHLPICRIPMSVTEYEISNFIQKQEYRTVFVLSDIGSRNSTFLASIFASLSHTDHILVVGAESYDHLQYFANLITIVIDDNLRTLTEPLLERLAEIQKLIASSSIDRTVIRAQQINVTDENILRYIILPQLLLRHIIPSAATPEKSSVLEKKKNDSPSEEESTPNKTSDEEQILDALKISFSIPNRQQKQLKTNAPSHGHLQTNTIANVGRRVNHSRVRHTNNGRFSLYRTLLAAAPFQKQRRLNNTTAQALYLEPDDIRRYPFKALSNRLTIIILDSSGSMATSSRIRFAKGFVEDVLKHSYQTRRFAALIVARGAEATIVTSPTRSMSRVSSALKILPTGGGTPIASALEKAIELSMLSYKRYQDLKIEIVLITDGKVNVERKGNANMLSDIQSLGKICAGQKIRIQIADIAKQSEAAQTLAKIVGGEYSFYSNDLHTSHIA